jgi:hypothetical protein
LATKNLVRCWKTIDFKTVSSDSTKYRLSCDSNRELRFYSVWPWINFSQSSRVFTIFGPSLLKTHSKYLKIGMTRMASLSNERGFLFVGFGLRADM